MTYMSDGGGFSSPEGFSAMQPGSEVSPEVEAPWATQADMLDTPTNLNPAEIIYNGILTGNSYALQNRFTIDPTPTQQELDIGVFVEEIQPQARDAVLLLREKGYDTGNVLGAGFVVGAYDEQQFSLFSPLQAAEQNLLEANGFLVEESRVSFRPADPTDLAAMKETWDWLAAMLPDLGQPAAPATFQNAVAFREAAAAGALVAAYTHDGQFNMLGVKYSPDRQPIELDPTLRAAKAVRELTHVDQYRSLKERLSQNPIPTPEEWNAGAYAEMLEPQVRDAIMLMRQKGYNTESSGFWGDTEQVIDSVSMGFDVSTKALLAEYGISTTNQEIRFSPEDPADLVSIKATWDMIAALLPDKGRHADPSESFGSLMFRHIIGRGLYDDYLEGWLYAEGALDGYMPALTRALLEEGRDFGSDVYEASRVAKAKRDAFRSAILREQQR